MRIGDLNEWVGSERRARGWKAGKSDQDNARKDGLTGGTHSDDEGGGNFASKKFIRSDVATRENIRGLTLAGRGGNANSNTITRQNSDKALQSTTIVKLEPLSPVKSNSAPDTNSNTKTRDSPKNSPSSPSSKGSDAGQGSKGLNSENGSKDGSKGGDRDDKGMNNNNLMNSDTDLAIKRTLKRSNSLPLAGATGGAENANNGGTNNILEGKKHNKYDVPGSELFQDRSLVEYLHGGDGSAETNIEFVSSSKLRRSNSNGDRSHDGSSAITPKNRNQSPQRNKQRNKSPYNKSPYNKSPYKSPRVHLKVLEFLSPSKISPMKFLRGRKNSTSYINDAEDTPYDSPRSGHWIASKVDIGLPPKWAYD
jgi:hypothetical protein